MRPPWRRKRCSVCSHAAPNVYCFAAGCCSEAQEPDRVGLPGVLHSRSQRALCISLLEGLLACCPERQHFGHSSMVFQ